MSVNLFNRPELGLGFGSIEVLDLWHMPISSTTNERSVGGVPFSESPLGEPLAGRTPSRG